MSFVPRFDYTHAMVEHLGAIEGARAVIEVLPLPPDTTLRLRHDALQRSTRSSTQIEGNPLDEAAVRRAIARSTRTGSDAEQEVRNYWRALDRANNPFIVAASDVAAWFGVSDNTAREWLKVWADEGFIVPVIVGSGQRVRNYTLAQQWIEAFFQNNGSQYAK